MLKSYIKVAFRNLLKNKGFYAINILGLAIGLATCLLITLYVLEETGYDKYNKNADRIFRVNADIRFGGDDQNLAVCPDPLAFTMVKDFPEVESAVRFRSYGPSLVKKGNQNIKEQRIIFTDSTLFKVFTLPMVEGDPAKALTQPKSVVITESIAKKYFNSNNAIGKVLTFDNKDDYQVTGVIKDVPEASHFKFDFFVSLAGVEEAQQNIWLNFNFNTYLLLKADADVAAFGKKFDEIMAKYMWPQAQQLMQINQDDFKKSGNYVKLSLMPVTDIHLKSDRVAELGPNNDVQFIYIFSIVAVFILLVACVNFMNLSTARSANRAKEVGVRKVLGTNRIALIRQFLTEAVIMSLLALILAVGIAFLLLPYLNSIAAKDLSFSPGRHPFLFPLLLLITIGVGVLAGIYPAFYLSRFKPIQVLKGTLSTGFKKSYLRSALVVFQFFVSIVLIIATIIIYQQLTFIQNKKLGFNKDQVVHIKDAYLLGNKAEVFKQEVLKHSEIIAGTKSGYLPVSNSSRSSQSLFPEGHIENDKAATSQFWQVDHDYIKTFGMEIVQGRDFSDQMLTDSNATVINETAVKLFGFGADPIGKKITEITDLEKKTTRDYTVIGVVKNFNYESLRQNIGALCMKLEPNNTIISFRLKGGNIKNSINLIQSTWKKIAPNEPFAYSFLNEEFDDMYRSEQRVGNVFISFAVLAILIACLGLFGLVTYAAEQRTKEIGIRKILGATISNIVAMLSKDFLKLVIIASIIAFPVAWWAMHNWLQDFAFRINISWWIFAIAAAVSLVIALVTISFQAIKAAIVNPTKSLKAD